MSATAATGHPIDITEGNFDGFVKVSGLVVVDCWAPWCGPCKRLEPILADLAREYAGRITFARLNTDENPSVSTKFGVMSIPTLLVFKGGQRVDQIVGLMPKEQLKSKLERHL